MTKKVTPKKVSTPDEPKYSKDVLLGFDGFTKIERDFLSAFLVEGKKYTIDETKQLLEKKLKGAVK